MMNLTKLNSVAFSPQANYNNKLQMTLVHEVKIEKGWCEQNFSLETI
jgi:hypothetical protein